MGDYSILCYVRPPWTTSSWNFVLLVRNCKKDFHFHPDLTIRVAYTNYFHIKSSTHTNRKIWCNHSRHDMSFFYIPLLEGKHHLLTQINNALCRILVMLGACFGQSRFLTNLHFCQEHDIQKPMPQVIPSWEIWWDLWNWITGKYYVEYTLQRIGEKQRHLVSVVGIGNNGWINRLYTVTGQVT